MGRSSVRGAMRPVNCLAGFARDGGLCYEHASFHVKMSRTPDNVDDLFSRSPGWQQADAAGSRPSLSDYGQLGRLVQILNALFSRHF